jgi:3-phosphoshikimate 1-carboxyvinyltransferase
MSANAGIAVEAKGIKLHPTDMTGFDFDATDCPDLFPPLVALASYCEGTTVIEGTGRLTHKESNRALTLQEEFGKMGVQIKLQDDLMLIAGKSQLKGAEVSSHSDHRIAMATAVAALKADKEMVVTGAEAVNKSYPQFWEHIKTLGAKVQTVD